MPQKRTPLDSLPPLEGRVGYGQLGIAGRWDTEDKQILAHGRKYPYALGIHATTRLLFKIDGSVSCLQVSCLHRR